MSKSNAIKPVPFNWDAEAAKSKRYYQVSNEVFEIDIKYEPIRLLGQGSYGTVCSAFNHETNEDAAIKKIRSAFKFKNNGIYFVPGGLRTLREIRLVRQINHPFVIRIKDVMKPLESQRTKFESIYVVYELMHTDLSQIIKCNRPISDDDCKLCLNQLLRALKYLHSANVLHRDLKPGNILVNKNMRIKICDFGLARVGAPNGHSMTEYLGSQSYMAPEALIGCSQYNSLVDVWSVGCIFARLLAADGCPIFQGNDYLDQLIEIANVIPKPDDDDLDFLDDETQRTFVRTQLPAATTTLRRRCPNANPVAFDLLQKMLVFDPRKRITVAEALRHPYMQHTTVDHLRHKLNLNPPEVDILNQTNPSQLDMDDDEITDEGLTEEELRAKVWDEILLYHDLRNTD